MTQDAAHNPAPHENADGRRADLIAATLRVIARDGLRAATVRAIAAEAKVTPGLIRYYFKSKADLIAAAYELHMSQMVHFAARASQGQGSARLRLADFIRASLQPPVTSHASVAVWAGFLTVMLHDEAMTASHMRSYDLLRLHLKRLFADVLSEAGAPASPARLRGLSIAGNAILDGLWLEGGALPDAFEAGELVAVGLESIGALLGIDLVQDGPPRVS